MKTLDRTQLKLIAICAMVIDHVAWGFVEFMTPLGQVMHVIGRFTIPIMCFFVAEGYRKTSSVSGYLKRMACFAVIAMIPFYLFFGDLYEYRQNIIFDLFLGLLMLAVLEHKKLKKWQKVIIAALIFYISATIGGWVIMPILYILVFYYVKDFKKQAAWICGLTILLQVFLIAAVELNRVLHFSKYDWPWYDKLYFLGFMLPLLVLKRYNGEKGKTIGGKYFFYLFYPAHFLVLTAIKAIVAGCSIYEIYVTLHVIALVICLAVLLLVLWAKPSRGQSGTLLLVLAGCIYTFGFLVEITSGNVGGFYAATLVQYFGECILMVGFTMFVGEMCRKNIPSVIYALEWVYGIFVMAMIMTTRQNGFFYTSIKMDETGPFPRQVLEYGMGFYLFVAYMVIVCVGCLSMCIAGAFKAQGFERKRMVCTAFAISTPWLPNLIRATGITGGYEIPCFGILGAVILVGLALTRYGYFDSIALAGENALSHGQEGIMVVDNRHLITYFNRQMEELFPNLILKRNIYKYSTLADIYEGKIKQLKIQDKIYEMRVEPLLEGGYIQGYMIWVLDVTEHHRLLLSRDRFLAYMSHEIRTPINAVLGMDTMILRETTDTKIKEYALDIQNAGKSLLSLINDILDFSKIESGKLEIIHAEYDFSSLIHDISNMLKAKAEKKKLQLQIHVDEALPSRLYGDDVRIRQVLVNLLNNAVKYTQQGSVTLRVGGKIEEGNAILDFSVEDTGIGIKEEDMVNLFEEFRRVEEKRNRNVEGTGLGLNITARLLRLMGSEIRVDSVYGEGSKFYFTLKQKVVDSTPVGNLEERIRKQATEYEYDAAFVAPDANILVVDDNMVNLKVFVGLLGKTGVKIDTADSGKACLEMIGEKQYDLIFLDHMMPEMDGIEVLHRMKTMDIHKNQTTPVVALTANAITGAKEMYLREGFDAFLSKPINPEKLEQMILRMLPKERIQYESRKEDKVTTLAHLAKEELLPIIDGIDWNYGQTHFPTKELLMETVEVFYKSLTVEAKSLEKFYEESNWQQYRIKVHGMKSSANMIGAIVLGGMAKVLEDASRDTDIETIDRLHKIYIKQWLGYTQKLEILFEKKEQQSEEKREVEDTTEVLTLLGNLRMACEEEDMDEMDRIMALLEDFRYTDDVLIGMEELSGLILNMESDEAMIKIGELTEQLKCEGWS